MSDLDYDALRKVAERASTINSLAAAIGGERWKLDGWPQEAIDHIAEFDPPTVLRLLDLAQRAEAAEADCDRWKTLANRLRGDGAALGRVRELIRPQWRANRGYYHRNTSEAYKAGRDDLIDAIRAALDRKEDQ